MSDAAIGKIRLAGKEAKELILASKTKSKEILGQAKEEAESLYKKLIGRARNLKKKKIQDMEKQAQEDSQDLLVKADSQVERLEEMKKQDYSELVRSVVEKVVV